jgi:hypothetical protein
MKRMMIIITIIIITSLAITLLIGKIMVDKQFDKKVTDLFAQSKNISDKKFTYNEIKDLPKPVQRYFKHVLKEGQSYISSVRLRHNGQFKNDLKKPWMNIEGEEYFVAEGPGYVWKGKTALFTAIDSYVEDKGRLTAYLFNIFKVTDGKGEKYDQGELLRWLGESVCFPTNLLPKENLQWLPINNFSARLHFQYNAISIYYIVYFNDKNEIIRMETERYIGDNKLEKWVATFSDYKEINEVIIPVKIEAGWQLKDEYCPYAKFIITNIQFNKPQIFDK